MKALVTGAAGFVGSWLIPELLENGCRVVAFDVAPRSEALRDFADKIVWVQGDLSSEADIYRTMALHGITDVFHLGALLAGPCETDPMKGFRVNFHSTETLLDASVTFHIRRFVMLSSIAVFGRDAIEPVKDDAAKNPETIYGQTKLAGEHLLRWYARNRNLDARALRLTWVFGPGRKTGITALYSSRILDAFARRQKLHVPNPDEKGDWLYIRDAVKAILTLWKTKDAPQQIYNISGGLYSIREVMDIAKNLCPDAPVTIAENGQTFSPYPVSYDDTPAQRELGWKPSYTIEEAVREHIETVGGHNL